MTRAEAYEVAKTPLDAFMLRHAEDLDMRELSRQSRVSMSLLYYLRRGERLGSMQAWGLIVATLQQYTTVPLSLSDFIDVEEVTCNDSRVAHLRRRTWFPKKAA